MARSRRQASRHGFLVIDKPAGWTSHDVVAKVRRLVGERRVGHGGTLDPAAVGVLPVAVGLATRTVEYLSLSSKAYRAEITFGIETDSGDIDGRVISLRGASELTGEEVRRGVSGFLGESLQLPPMHSAVKVGGQRLYSLARRGETLDVEPRVVSFGRLDIVSWSSPVLTVDIECSRGTYIRALARDLGAITGTGAYLSHLVRTRSGPFTLDDAMMMEDMLGLIDSRGWSNVAFHPDWALLDCQSAVLPPDQAGRWWNGLEVSPSGFESGVVRVYNESGSWLGVGETLLESGSIVPRKVIPPESSEA